MTVIKIQRCPKILKLPYSVMFVEKGRHCPIREGQRVDLSKLEVESKQPVLALAALHSSNNGKLPMYVAGHAHYCTIATVVLQYLASLTTPADSTFDHLLLLTLK